MYFKWFVSFSLCLYSLWFFSFWHRLYRKWGWFLALLSVVIKKKIKGERLGDLLRQWVAGGWGWGRCVELLLLLQLLWSYDATLVGEWRSRRAGQGWPCCCLGKKNTWTEKGTRRPKMEVRIQIMPAEINLHFKSNLLK